jgi:hypothetical protein
MTPNEYPVPTLAVCVNPFGLPITWTKNESQKMRPMKKVTLATSWSSGEGLDQTLRQKMILTESSTVIGRSPCPVRRVGCACQLRPASCAPSEGGIR